MTVNPLYDRVCEGCLGTSNVCDQCGGTEGPDVDNPENNCECQCTAPDWVACDDCQGLGYYSDDPDNESDDQDGDDDPDSDICPDCDGTGEIEEEDDDGNREIVDCDCIEEDLEDD
mgnify:CR=1 FL=1